MAEKIKGAYLTATIVAKLSSDKTISEALWKKKNTNSECILSVLATAEKQERMKTYSHSQVVPNQYIHWAALTITLDETKMMFTFNYCKREYLGYCSA